METKTFEITGHPIEEIIYSWVKKPTVQRVRSRITFSVGKGRIFRAEENGDRFFYLVYKSGKIDKTNNILHARIHARVECGINCGSMSEREKLAVGAYGYKQIDPATLTPPTQQDLDDLLAKYNGYPTQSPTPQQDLDDLLAKYNPPGYPAISTPLPTKPVFNGRHKNYNELCAMLNAGLYPLLVGPAGTGKSTAAEHYAKDNNLRQSGIGAFSDPYFITGALSPTTGNYIPTEFYDYWANGGVFLFDDIGSSSSFALQWLNMGLSNGYLVFPCGKVIKHEKCILIFGDNTTLTGATAKYAREKQDEALRDRLDILEWGPDEDLEVALLGKEISQLLDKCRQAWNNSKNTTDEPTLRRAMSYKKLVEAGMTKTRAFEIAFVRLNSKQDILRGYL